MLVIRGSKYLAVPLLRFALAVLPFSSLASASSTSGSITVGWNRNPETNISGYKVYWGETTRNYTKVVDAGNGVEATLSNLTPGLTYYCAVTAYNIDGQESPYSSEIHLTSVIEPGAGDPSARLVLVEAESGTETSPLAAATDAGVTYISCPSYPASGTASIPLNIPVADEYHVWCRIRGGTESSDSIYISMDNTTVEDIFHFYAAPNPLTGSRNSGWVWKKIFIPPASSPPPTATTVLVPRVYSLSAGNHTFRFRGREQNAQVDRVVFTSDPTFVPDDTLPRSGDALAVTGSPVSLTKDPGQSAIFMVTAAATGPVSYQWKKNGVAIGGANSAMLVINSLDYSHAGSYSVALSSGSINTNVGPAALVVNAVEPEQIFRVNKVTMNPDTSVVFEVEGELDTEILVYASSDMKTWSLIARQPNSVGRISVFDAGAASKTRRFYKLVSENAPL